MADSEYLQSLIRKGDILTRPCWLTMWRPDWRIATRFYEQAAYGFRLAQEYERAKAAFLKASEGQEKLSSPRDAARHFESAAAMAKNLCEWSEVAGFYRHASKLYMECGRSRLAAEAIAKGARALEDVQPDESIMLYTDACALLEEAGKANMTFDLYRAATNVYIKREKYRDAANFYLKWGRAAEKCSAQHCQCKAYLSAVILSLYARDFEEVERCYNDCCQIEVFLQSDQKRCASELLSAYTDRDIDRIKRVAQSSTVSDLDHMIIRLARKLPTRDVS